MFKLNGFKYGNERREHEREQQRQRRLLTKERCHRWNQSEKDNQSWSMSIWNGYEIVWLFGVLVWKFSISVRHTVGSSVVFVVATKYHWYRYLLHAWQVCAHDILGAFYQNTTYWSLSHIHILFSVWHFIFAPSDKQRSNWDINRLQPPVYI